MQSFQNRQRRRYRQGCSLVWQYQQINVLRIQRVRIQSHTAQYKNPFPFAENLKSYCLFSFRISQNSMHQLWNSVKIAQHSGAEKDLFDQRLVKFNVFSFPHLHLHITKEQFCPRLYHSQKVRIHTLLL